MSEQMQDAVVERLDYLIETYSTEEGGQFIDLPLHLQQRVLTRIVEGAMLEHRLWQRKLVGCLKAAGLRARDRIILSDSDSDERRALLSEIKRIKRDSKEVWLVASQASGVLQALSQ